MTEIIKKAREKSNLLKEKIFARNNYQCAICKNTKSLQLAHIRPLRLLKKKPELFDELTNEKNLITLCKNCHRIFDKTFQGNFTHLIKIFQNLYRFEKTKKYLNEEELAKKIEKIGNIYEEFSEIVKDMIYEYISLYEPLYIKVKYGEEDNDIKWLDTDRMTREHMERIREMCVQIEPNFYIMKDLLEQKEDNNG